MGRARPLQPAQRTDRVMRRRLLLGSWQAGAEAMTVQEQVQLHTNRLKDSKANVRVQAAKALSEIGPPAQAAVAALVEALHDEDVSVRLAASTALGEIGPAAQAAIPPLIEALRDPDPEAGASAATALGKVREAAVPALVEALSNA